MLINKINGIIIFLGIIFLSCETQPLLINPVGSDLLTRHNLLLSPNSNSKQDSILVGNSQRLYSGKINEQDSYTLIKLDLESFIANHPVCDTIISFNEPSVSLQSITDISSYIDSNYELKFNSENLNIYALNYLNVWDEAIDFLDDNATSFFSDIIDNQGHELEYSLEDENLIEIFLLSDSNDQIEDSYIDLWCNNNDIGLLVEYLPDIGDSIEYIEWNSSEAYSLTSRPRLNIDFISMDIVPKLSNQTIIDTVISPYNFHYIDNDSSIWQSGWGHFYFMDLDTSVILDNVIESNQIPSNGSLSIPINEIETLAQITLSANLEIIDSISVIDFSLSNAKAYLLNDPQNDNTENGGTENNNEWDHLDINGNNIIDSDESYELWDDFGLDRCSDYYENGFQGCCIEKSEIDCSTDNGCIFEDSICVSALYNSEGRSGNGKWDFIDLNENGIFDVDIDEFELWDDFGIGEAYEDDPAGDNYIEDSVTNNDPTIYTENNGIYDEGIDENLPGELCLDYGIDGLPNTNDSNENDGICSEFEFFFDTGRDGLFSIDEEGYSMGPTGNDKWDYVDSNNNGMFDVGEVHEVWIDEGIGLPYNIDPNIDNYNPSAGHTDSNQHTEGNSIFDFIDSSNHEVWYDFGIDQIPDSLEHLDSNIVLIALGDNDYTIDINNFIEFSHPMPPLNVINEIYIWISSINKTNNQYVLDVSIWSEHELKGVEFGLSIDPIEWTDEFEVFHSTQFSEINTAKLFEDISLYNVETLDSSALYSSDLLRLNYSNNITIDLIVEGLDSFVYSNQNSLISDNFSYLVLPIDTSISYIDPAGALLYIENDSAIFDSYTINYNSSSIDIPIGLIMQAYVNGLYPESQSFNFKLSLSGNYYNFSDIYIMKDKCYMEILYTN